MERTIISHAFFFFFKITDDGEEKYKQKDEFGDWLKMVWNRRIW